MTYNQKIEVCKQDFYEAVKTNNPEYALVCVKRLKELLRKKNAI